MEPQQRLYILFRQWLDRTEGILIQQLQKQKIGITHALRNQLRKDLQVKGEGYLEGNITMLTRGRYIDMGVGRGQSLSGSTRGSFSHLEDGRSGRKPKKWYSRTFFSRLYDLYGAIGYEIVEECIQTVKEPIQTA